MKRFHGWLAWSLVAGACVGCGGSKEGDTTAGGPAGRPVTANAGAVPPQEVVMMFSDSIRRGDRDMAMKLITSAGRQEIQRSGMALDPPGSAESSYKIGEVRFFDEDKDAAYVASMWIEPVAPGQPPVETEVVWAVQLEKEGWRISGLAIDQGKDQPPFLVDFENLEQSMKEQQQAAAPADKVAAGQQTMQTPPAQQPSQGASASMQQPPQAGTAAVQQPTQFGVPPTQPPAQFGSAPIEQPNFQKSFDQQPATNNFAVPAIAAPQPGQVPNQLR